MASEATPRKQLKRVRVEMPEESPARKAGLIRIQAEREGFVCGCGTHRAFSAYVLAHWSEMLQLTCPACGRTHKVKDGKVSEISGPVKKLSKVKKQEGDMVDPTKPLWRCYHQFNNGPLPVTYGPASNYCDTIDQANAEGWEYCNRTHPNHRERREELFRNLIRQQEFPLLSTVTRDGMIVGGGFLQSIGNRLSTIHGGDIMEFELRDPKGRVTRITLLPEVWKEMTGEMELKAEKPAEAIKRKRRERGE